MSRENMIRRLKMLCCFLETVRIVSAIFGELLPNLGFPVETAVIFILRDLSALAEAVISAWIMFSTSTQQDK